MLRIGCAAKKGARHIGFYRAGCILIIAAFVACQRIAGSPKKAMVNLLSVSFETQYLADEVSIEYQTIEDPPVFPFGGEHLEGWAYVAEVRSTEGEVLDTFTEYALIPVDEVRSSEGEVLDKTYKFNVATVRDFQVSAYVWANVRTSVASSGKLIDEVISYGHCSAAPSSYWFEEVDTALGVTELSHEKFELPANKLAVSVSGTIYIDDKNNLGLTYGKLEELGFEMSGSLASWEAAAWYSPTLPVELIPDS